MPCALTPQTTTELLRGTRLGPKDQLVEVRKFGTERRAVRVGSASSGHTGFRDSRFELRRPTVQVGRIHMQILT